MSDALPPWPPRGMREDKAAYYVGFSPATLRRTARIMLDAHGEAKTRRLLTARLDTDRPSHRAITVAVLEAVGMLAADPAQFPP